MSLLSFWCLSCLFWLSDGLSFVFMLYFWYHGLRFYKREERVFDLNNVASCWLKDEQYNGVFYWEKKQKEKLCGSC
jgi:hypothetical protein